MRLTKKVNKGMNGTPIYVGSYGNIVNVGDNQATSMVHHKLGQLEDIEEDSEIDIIKSVDICYKANIQGFVFVKEHYGIEKLILHHMLDFEIFHHRLYSNECGMYVSLDLLEYGIGWALTKEELIDEK